MTVAHDESAAGALTEAEATMLAQWSASMGPVRAAFRVTWNGTPGFAGIVRTGITLVHADDSGAGGFARGSYTVTTMSETARRITATTSDADGPGRGQLVEFETADAAAEFDRGWAESVRASTVAGSPQAQLDRWVSILANLSEFVFALGMVVAILGIFGSVTLFAHTGPVLSSAGHLKRAHDLVGYGFAALLGTAVTTALLIAVGAIGKVLALQEKTRSTDADS